MDVLGAKTSRTRPSKTKIRRGPGGEASYREVAKSYTVKPLLTDILYNGHLPATDNSNCTNSLCHSHNTKEASLQRTPLCSGERTLLTAPNSSFTSELRTKWAGPVLNQQDWAKNGWGHLKSGWGEEDSACAHAWQRSCKRRL